MKMFFKVQHRMSTPERCHCCNKDYEDHGARNPNICRPCYIFTEYTRYWPQNRDRNQTRCHNCFECGNQYARLVLPMAHEIKKTHFRFHFISLSLPHPLFLLYYTLPRSFRETKSYRNSQRNCTVFSRGIRPDLIATCEIRQETLFFRAVRHLASFWWLEPTCAAATLFARSLSCPSFTLLCSFWALRQHW